MEVKGAQIERTEDGAVNDLSVDLFLLKQPELLPLYLEIERAVRDRLGDFEVVVQKSQITWERPRLFRRPMAAPVEKAGRADLCGAVFFSGISGGKPPHSLLDRALPQPLDPPHLGGRSWRAG